MEKNKITLDEVLDSFSIFGRYHLRFMIFAFYVYITNGLLPATYIFTIEETKYRCKDETFINNTCGTVNGVKCSQWIYEKPNSFIAEFNLACQEWKGALVGTAHSFGYMVGLFLVGPLSDRIGRKKAIILSGIMGATIGLVQSFSPSYWFYATMECLVAMLGDTHSPLFVLNLEIVSSKNRVTFQTLASFGLLFGSILFAVTAWGIPYWRHLLQAIYSPTYLIIALCLIDESPRWLLSKGKKDKAIVVLQKMSDMNKLKLDKEDLDSIYVEDENKSIAFVKLLKLTLQSRTLLKRIAVCIVWWTTATFVNHGIMIYSVSLQGNKFVNYILLDLVDLPGNFIIIYIMNNYKRKNPLMYTFFAAAALFFVHPFLPSDLPWLSITVYMASKLMSSFYFTITYIYTTELFPTYTRNSMHALCSAIGRIGAMTAPQIPLLMVYWYHLPTLLFGAASLCAGLVTLLVPDTADDALPDTVQQAEHLGKTNKNCSNIVGIDDFGLAE